MQLKSLGLIIAGFIISVSSFVNVAKAGLITEQWQATVIFQEPSPDISTAYGVGTLLNWTVTYDEGCPDWRLDLINCENNATFNFGSIFDDIMNVAPDGFEQKVLESPEFPYSNRYTPEDDIVYGIFYSYLSTDSKSLFATPNWAGNDNGGHFSIQGEDNASLTLYFNEMKNVSDVPEPSTLAIFALGMIGLASRRFKKQ